MSLLRTAAHSIVSVFEISRHCVAHTYLLYYVFPINSENNNTGNTYLKFTEQQSCVMQIYQYNTDIQWSNYRKISRGPIYRGVNLYITLGDRYMKNWGRQILKKLWKVQTPKARSCLRLPKARSPSRLGGLGERRKLPSGVWDGAPETEAILNILFQNGVIFGSC